MTADNQINYIEFYANDLTVIKTFYNLCFNWKFTDFGPNYTAFENSGISGGFEKSNATVSGGPLVVIHHQNLEQIKQLIIVNGGEITVDIFSFPGGKRFQFKDPSGNELAVWTED